MPSCLACAIHTRESLVAGLCHWQSQNFNEIGLRTCTSFSFSILSVFSSSSPPPPLKFYDLSVATYSIILQGKKTPKKPGKVANFPWAEPQPLETDKHLLPEKLPSASWKIYSLPWYVRSNSSYIFSYSGEWSLIVFEYFEKNDGQRKVNMTFKFFLHFHLSIDRAGRLCTTDCFTISFLHFSLYSTALKDLANSRPVNSLMLSSHLCFCLPCLLYFTLSLCLARCFLTKPDERETCPYHFSFRLFMMDRRSSCNPIACSVLGQTSLLVTWSLCEMHSI